MNFDSTIIIPMWGQPNHLATCLRGLVRNSALSHHIIVAWSNPAVMGEVTVRDWAVNEQLQRYQKYHSIEEYIKVRGTWCTQHHIEFIDVTEQALALRTQYGSSWINGHDIALKNNISLAMTQTEFVVPNWDADFYPAPGWDRHLFELIRQHSQRNAVFIPTHVQAYPYNPLPEISDAWTQFRGLACNRLTLPVLDPQCSVTEEEWEAFVTRWGRDEEKTEPCGLRDWLHYLPMLYYTEEILNIGGYSYVGTSYEVEIDTRLGQQGWTKFSSRRSFILHKGFIACISEDI